MSSRVATKRLTSEYKSLQQQPAPFVETHPSDEDILEWPYIITGPPDTPFEGGKYVGTLKFPPNYPFAPPRIKMLTPSGRFEPGTRLCLTMSDYHPETWNPAWNVSSILTGLLSFMCSNEVATGALISSPATRQSLAKKSIAWNLKNGYFLKHFPELAAETKVKLEEAKAEAGDAESQSSNAQAAGSKNITEKGGLEDKDKLSDRRQEARRAQSHGSPLNSSLTLVSGVVATAIVAFGVAYVCGLC